MNIISTLRTTPSRISFAALLVLACAVQPAQAHILKDRDFGPLGAVFAPLDQVQDWLDRPAEPAKVEQIADPVPVDGDTVGLTISPSGPYNPGANIVVRWRAPADIHFKSFVALVDPAQPQQGQAPKYDQRQALNGQTNGEWSLVLPNKTGEFEVRIFDPWAQETVALTALKITQPDPAQTATSTENTGSGGDVQAGTQPIQPGTTLVDNWNKSRCGTTDTIRFSLKAETNVGLFRTWIKWPKGLTEVEYSLNQKGKTILQSKVQKQQCDPNQQNWCQGWDNWDTTLGAGNYLIKTSARAVCRNSGSKGNGFIALDSGGATSPAAEGETTKPATTETPVQAPTSGGYTANSGPFSGDEARVGDFSASIATTKGIIEDYPVGAKAGGSMHPGDVDMVLFELTEDSPVKITFEPCSRQSQLRLLDIDGNELFLADDIHSGYSGLYSIRRLDDLKKGVYALEVSHIGDTPCSADYTLWSVWFEPGWKIAAPARD